jgi:hypothetical protein
MKVLTGGACLCFLAFAVARAARVPLTYDEAASYLRYIDTAFPSVFNTGLLSVFNFEVATNHFLNTLLTKVAYLLAGGSEIVLRLPNLLGYAMYIGFAALILFRYTRPAIACAGCVLLNLNPYVLDFFTLSRGYGLSLGFLMGALFFLLEASARTPARSSHAIPRALLFGLLAVMANFALLNAYVAIFTVAFVATVAAGRSGTGATSIPPAAGVSPRVRLYRSWMSLAAVAFLFNALVLSQDVELTPALYQPISISLSGVTPPELDTVRVTRIDIRGRERRLRRDPGATAWHVAPDHVRSLRIEVPAAAAATLRRIEVIVGNHSFSSAAERQDLWSHREVGGIRVFESAPALAVPQSRTTEFRPVINWAGDRLYLREVLTRTGYALLVLALLAITLRGLGSLVVRAGLLTSRGWRPFDTGAVWMAALAGTPIYLLRRDSELYFGGTHGLFQDTFASIIENSFYGRHYHPAQRLLVVAAIAATLLAFLAALYAAYRRRRMLPIVPATVLFAVIAIASLSIVAQGTLLHTVYLVGRTALFFLPLYVLFLVLVCDAVASFGTAARGAALTVLCAAVGVSIWHFGVTANVTHTLDWISDAGTRPMMNELSELVARERGPGGEAVLGVDWIYRPVAVYYAHRTSSASIEVVGLPPPAAPDFFYVEDKDRRPNPRVVRRYELAGSVLMRADGRP